VRPGPTRRGFLCRILLMAIPRVGSTGRYSGLLIQERPWLSIKPNTHGHILQQNMLCRAPLLRASVCRAITHVELPFLERQAARYGTVVERRNSMVSRSTTTSGRQTEEDGVLASRYPRPERPWSEADRMMGFPTRRLVDPRWPERSRSRPVTGLLGFHDQPGLLSQWLG